MLDYFEGKLSNEQIVALKAFAVLHPELDLNFDEELVQLENETIRFSDKQSLKANFNDELVIGYLENTLTDKEKKAADTLIKTNAVFINELNLYKKTIAQPDERIVFENKAQLKREPKVIFFSQTVTMRIAAAILLLAGLWFMVSKLVVTEQISTPELAKTEIKNKVITPIENNSTEAITTTNEKQLAIANKMKSATVIKKQKQLHTTEPSTITIATTTVNNSPFIANNENENKQVKPTYLDTNALKLASEFTKEKTQRKVIIEEEADDENLVANNTPKKGKLWGLASKALRSLNKNGIEKVNSSNNSNNLFIGALTISKNN